MRAGFGSVDITPPLGCVLAGAFLPRISDKIHDPLFAHAVVVENASRRICLVSCDLISLAKTETDRAMELIRANAGIPRENIIICATHIHTGPVTRFMDFVPGFEKATDEKWISLLPHYICSAVLQAVNSMRECGFACASGFEDEIAFNRRFLMKDGSVKTNPGVGNPDIDKAVGPIDPEVGVMAFGQNHADIHGIAANYTLHVDTWTGRKQSISADFPGVVKRVLKSQLGGGTGFVYISGAMGNINHIDVKRDGDYEYGDFEFPSRIGSILGSEIVKTVSRVKQFQTDVSIGSGRAEVELPLKKYDETALKKAHSVISEKLRDGSPLNDREYMESIGFIRASALGRDSHVAAMTAVRIGGAAVVSIPGEYFVELGLYIKEKSPFPGTFIAELGNDCLGYIATEEAYEQGAYEPVSSPLERGAGEILADGALKLLRSLE